MITKYCKNCVHAFESVKSDFNNGDQWRDYDCHFLLGLKHPVKETTICKPPLCKDMRMGPCGLEARFYERLEVGR